MSVCSGGGGRHGVLQTDVLQLQTDQTGSAEGNSPPHPLRSESGTKSLYLINCYQLNIKE